MWPRQPICAKARRLVAVPAIDTHVAHRDPSDYDRMPDLDQTSLSEQIA
ncbi:hypothetical protein [Nocardia sp. NPDC050710]